MIQTGDELAELLARALQIEDGFESLGQWEAYVRTKDPEFRRMIFDMLGESTKHKRMIGDLLKMVIVSYHADIVPLSPTKFDFTGKEQLEVMDELYQTEVLMRDTYSLIGESIPVVDLGKLIIPGNEESFLKMLNELVSDESRHASIVSARRGKVERIR